MVTYYQCPPFFTQTRKSFVKTPWQNIVRDAYSSPYSVPNTKVLPMSNLSPTVHVSTSVVWLYPLILWSLSVSFKPLTTRLESIPTSSPKPDYPNDRLETNPKTWKWIRMDTWRNILRPNRSLRRFHQMVLGGWELVVGID